MAFSAADPGKPDLQHGDEMTTCASRYATAPHCNTANKYSAARTSVEKQAQPTKGARETQDAVLSSYQATAE